MAYIKQDEVAAVRGLMRSMYFSNGTIGQFLSTATAGQVSAVRDLIQSGTRVYITTQCPEGGVHLHKYEVGRRAEALGAISLGSRTFEDALGALMCGEL